MARDTSTPASAGVYGASPRRPAAARRKLPAMGRVAALTLTIAAAGTGCDLVAPDGSSGVGAAHVFWRADVPALGPPALDSATVFFSLRDHRFAAVDRVSGAVRWITRSGIPGSNIVTQDVPVRAASTVVFGDSQLFGLDPATGAIEWVFGDTLAVNPGAGIYPFRTDGARIYAGSVIGAVFALDAGTGRQTWRTDILPSGDTQMRIMAVRDGRVYVDVKYDGPRYSGRVYALDAATGAVVWSYAPSQVGPSSTGTVNGVLTTPDASGRALFVVSLLDGRVVGLDAATGTPQWTIPPVVPDTAEMLSLRWMTASGSVLVVASPGPDLVSGFALADGAALWTARSDQGSPFDAELTSDSAFAYVVFSNGRLAAYDLQTGSRRWLREAPVGFFAHGPRASHDTLFLGGYDAAYAIQR